MKQFGLWIGLSVILLAVENAPATAQQQYAQYPAYQLNRFYYFPYVYYPHNYWPATAPRWPEQPGMPYQRPPAYQAWPPFRDPNYRYEFNQPQKYYKGHHFWLDQF